MFCWKEISFLLCCAHLSWGYRADQLWTPCQGWNTETLLDIVSWLVTWWSFFDQHLSVNFPLLTRVVYKTSSRSLDIVYCLWWNRRDHWNLTTASLCVWSLSHHRHSWQLFRSSSGSRASGPGLPCPQDFFKIMQFSGNLKGKTPILSKVWAQGPPLGSKLHWATLTKLLDPRLSCGNSSTHFGTNSISWPV